MSIRLLASASITGELKESLHEALESATSKLEAQAKKHGHRVVWDTAHISIDSLNEHSVAGHLIIRRTDLSIEALCVEEPTDA